MTAPCLAGAGQLLQGWAGDGQVPPLLTPLAPAAGAAADGVAEVCVPGYLGLKLWSLLVAPAAYQLYYMPNLAKLKNL